MLNAAEKYRFVPVAGHNIDGITSLNDDVLRWQNVSWINEAIGEYAGVLGISGLNRYTCANYLRAADIQRVIDWMNLHDARAIGYDDRFFTSWLPDVTTWTKIGDYGPSVDRNIVTTAESSARTDRFSARIAASRMFGVNFAAAAGDPFRVELIRSLLRAFPNRFNVSVAVAPRIKISGKYSGTTSGGLTIGGDIVALAPFSGNPPPWYDRDDKSQHAFFSETVYSGGSVSYSYSTDTSPVSPVSLTSPISLPYCRNHRLFGEMIAIAYNNSINYQSGVSTYSASTYRREIIDQGAGVDTGSLDWPTLKGLSAPAVPVPVQGEVIHGVYVLEVVGVDNLVLDSSIYT